MVVILGREGKESRSAGGRRAEESKGPGQEAAIPTHTDSTHELAGLGTLGSPRQQGLMGGKDSHL